MHSQIWQISSFTGRMSLFSRHITHMTSSCRPNSLRPFQTKDLREAKAGRTASSNSGLFFGDAKGEVSSLRSPFFQFQIHPILFRPDFCPADSTSGATTALQLTKPGFGRFNDPSGACDGISSLMDSVALRAPTSKFRSRRSAISTVSAR